MNTWRAWREQCVSQLSSNSRECPAKSLPLIEKEEHSPSGWRKSLRPLRRSRSGGQGRCCIQAVHAKAVAGRPSFGGRRITERRHQFSSVCSARGQPHWLASSIAVKVRMCSAKIEPSFISRPAMPACLTRRSTPTCYSRLRRLPPAG